MLKAKKVMVENEMTMVCVENCAWHEMLTKDEVMDCIDCGWNIPENVMIECLDAYLQAQEDGEILEFDRNVQTTKMETLYNFMLIDEETYGIGTEEEISAISKEKNAPVWIQVRAEFINVESYVCEGGEILDGTYLLSDGLLEVADGELEHIVLKAVI